MFLLGLVTEVSSVVNQCLNVAESLGKDQKKRRVYLCHF